MRYFAGFYTTKRTFYIRSNLRGHWSFTPSVLKLTTSPSFAKLVTWMHVTLLPGLFTRIVIDYSSTSVHFMYLRMFHCIHVCILWNCNHLRFVMWLNKEIWWWWWWLFFCIWNSLPHHVVDVDTVNQFKARLDRFWANQDVKWTMLYTWPAVYGRPCV